MIATLTPKTDGTIELSMPLQKFICVHDNGETFVCYTQDKNAAIKKCTELSQYGKPWKVLAYPKWID